MSLTQDNTTVPVSNEDYDSVWAHLMGLDFHQGWIDAAGIKTRYVQAGPKNAPALICVHGIAGSWECFCANLKAYAQHFNVIAFDLMGAGFSAKPEKEVYEVSDYVRQLKGLMEALNVDAASFVGVSMGSWISARFASDYPQHTRKLVICAASGMTRPPNANVTAVTSIRNDRSAAVDDPTWERVANVFKDLIHDERKRLPDFIKVRQTVYRLPEMKASMQRILAITHNENYARSAIADEDWRRIAAPVLLIESTDDSEHFRNNTARAAGLLPNAKRVAMSKVAHWPQFEDHATFNKISLEFLLA